MKRFLITMAATLLCAPCLFATTPSDDAESQGQQTQPANFTVTVGDVTFKMIWVEGGRFDMGNPAGVGYIDERPQHEVTLDGYWIAETEVTQGLWQAVMGAEKGWTRGYDYGSNYPAYNVSYDEAIDFCNKLNELTDNKYGFRLPTEAEWEYAARGGNKSKGYTFSGSKDNIDNVAWYSGNSNSRTHVVKTKAANELGIYDMSGNVFEWCSDWYDSNYYENSPAKNPKGPSTGDDRVLRGGGWNCDADGCCVAYRYCYHPDDSNINYGFRLAVSSSL